MRFYTLYVAAATIVLAAGIAGAAAASSTPTAPPKQDGAGGSTGGYHGECVVLATNKKKVRCLIEAFYRDIVRSGDPARELPRIDARVHRARGFVEAACHMVMHSVGARYARRHRLTLASLYRYVPRSNDPTCSAGFGMGLVIGLGPKIVNAGAKGLFRMCSRLKTRFRRYTCVHGIGHAHMQVLHGDLRTAVGNCRSLPQQAPDCAQGAFHDYWMTLSPRAGAKKLPRSKTSPRIVCGRQIRMFVRPCWYRAYLERPPKGGIDGPQDVLRVCRGLEGVHRSGCVSAASLIVSTDPFEQADTCAALDGADSVSCMRGVVVQRVAGSKKAQLELIRKCEEVDTSARSGCYSWMGRALAVVTNGEFGEEGCPKLREEAPREACTEGARRMNAPLITFS